jgi:hypothetical protein
MAEALETNTALRTLDLRNSAHLKDAGLAALGNVLNRKNNTLEMLLYSDCNNLSAAAKAALRRSLRGGRAREEVADSSHPWGCERG